MDGVLNIKPNVLTIKSLFTPVLFIYLDHPRLCFYKVNSILSRTKQTQWESRLTNGGNEFRNTDE